MAEKNNLDDLRGVTLHRIERSERNFKLGLLAFVLLDSLFILTFLFIMDRSNKLHQLLFVATGGFYLLIILGLIVLGLHVRRDTQLVLKAIETLGDQLAGDRS